MTLRLPILVSISVLALAVFVNACKKPTAFGSELLGDEYADFDFTDTITVECTLLREDSVVTSDLAAGADHFLCGEINDPVFGKYRSDIYSLLQASTLNPVFDSTTLDSIILYLKYAPVGIYGDTLQPVTLRIMRLQQPLIRDSIYYSNATIPEGEELGRIDNFLPKPNATDSLFEGSKGNFLRIRLNDDFAKELMMLDSVDWVSDSSVYRKLRGLKIVVGSNNASPGSMLAFDLNNNTFSRMSIYYDTKDDSTQNRFDFFFRPVNKFTHFEHDFAGTEVASHLNKPVDERMYLQGMQGFRLKVTFPYANNLNNIAVNKAQLVLTVADDNTNLPPAQQLIITESSGDTSFVFISDILYALNSSAVGSLSGFGGFPEKEFVNGNTLVNRYRLAISEKFQHIIDDDVAPNIKNRTIYLNVYPRVRTARRSVLFGPKSATFPAKLELKYTRVK